MLFSAVLVKKDTSGLQTSTELRQNKFSFFLSFPPRPFKSVPSLSEIYSVDKDATGLQFSIELSGKTFVFCGFFSLFLSEPEPFLLSEPV